jgi:hypothetical protein
MATAEYDFASGALIRLLREFEPAARPVQLVVPTARQMPPAVRAGHQKLKSSTPMQYLVFMGKDANMDRRFQVTRGTAPKVVPPLLLSPAIGHQINTRTGYRLRQQMVVRTFMTR